MTITGENSYTIKLNTKMLSDPSHGGILAVFQY